MLQRTAFGFRTSRQEGRMTRSDEGFGKQIKKHRNFKTTGADIELTYLREKPI